MQRHTIAANLNTTACAFENQRKVIDADKER